MPNMTKDLFNEIEDAKSRLAKILGREEEPWERDDEEET